MYPMFSWGFYILVNMALLLGATPLLDSETPAVAGTDVAGGGLGLELGLSQQSSLG